MEGGTTTPQELAVLDALGDLGGTATAAEVAGRIREGGWWQPSPREVGRRLGSLERMGRVSRVEGTCPHRWTDGPAPRGPPFAEEVLEALRALDEPWAMSSRVASAVGADGRTAGAALARLEREGLVERYPGVRPTLWRPVGRRP